MSLCDREYMRDDRGRSNGVRPSESQGSRLVGISRSEKISLGVGGIVIVAFLILALA
jgi:hypothetical protein